MKPQSSLRDSVVLLAAYPSTSCWAKVKTPRRGVLGEVWQERYPPKLSWTRCLRLGTSGLTSTSGPLN